VSPVLLTAEAEADVEEAFSWYEGQRPGLGAAFRHTLDVALLAVASRPATYPVIHRSTRRFLLPKFPYALYYRILDEGIVVVGCIHAKRNPRTWRSRWEG